MSISQSYTLLASDVSSLISSIKTEQSRRGLSQESETIITSDKALASYLTKLNSDLVSINAVHTCTQTTTSHTNTGTKKTLTSSTFTISEEILASAVAKLSADITTLANQCSCNSYYNTYCSNAIACTNGCSCNPNSTCCNGQCSNATSCTNGCSCNPNSACCNGQCCNSYEACSCQDNCCVNPPN